MENIGLLEAFGLGVLSSLTPCVYPLIPITLALFGAKEVKSRLEGFSLGLSYVLGISFTYTILGMISAKLGLVFGSALGNIWVILILNLFLFLILLQTLELIEFRFISKIQTKASTVGGKGLTGAFLMGTVSGLVAAPCIGPALVSILSAAAKSQNAAWGAALLFVYSLGLGGIFLILATFSGLVQKLPKSGSWLNIVKFLLACLLVMIIIFLSQRFLMGLLQAVNIYNNPSLLLVLNNSAIFLAWASYKNNLKVLRLCAAFIMGFTFYQYFLPHAPPSALQAGQAQTVKWISDFDEALNTSKNERKYLIVDLYADWCTACKEFELITFTDPKVLERFSTTVNSRIDFTDVTSPAAVRINERYEIPGLPVIMILKPDGSGEEVPGSRITGFLGPQEFLSHLEKYIK